MQYSELYIQDVERSLQQVPNLHLLYGHSVLVTGATGLIGSCVVDALLYLNKYQDAGIIIMVAGRNRERVIQRFCQYEIGKDYLFLHYDAASTEPLSVKADYIIHAASPADPKGITSAPVETILANVIGLNTLLRSAHEQGLKRFLYVSSSEVYGKKSSAEPYQETDYGYIDVLNPRAAYPNAKRAAESLCIAYIKEYDLDGVIVRPGHIYGPTVTASDSRASSQFPRDLIAGKDIVMKSAGSQLRSYCYVTDCASAILCVLLNGIKGEAYNISNKDAIVSIREMAEAFAHACGKEVLFDKASIQEQATYNLMDNSSLNAMKLEALGWKAIFNMQEGAKHTLEILKIYKR